jgi:hypothetical protein
MAIPYRRPKATPEDGCAAYLDVIPGQDGVLLGALLLLDRRGRPLEFVHNRTYPPGGWMWPDELQVKACLAAIAHSLFDACRREPDLVVCKRTLGPNDYLRSELAPSIPMVVAWATGDGEIQREWVNDPPTPGMRSHALAPELESRGFLFEPFDRILRGLRVLYPTDLTRDEADDPVP